MSVVDGVVAPGFEAVREVFQSQFESGQHIGAAVAVYHRGHPVVDLWGGLADEDTGAPWREDTMTVGYSTTKGLTATCLHVLADRGRIDYDAPVAKYWPEFAARGKGSITVRHVLTHQAGIPQLPAGIVLDDLCDWHRMARGIEDLAPLWQPGTASGYHALTFGWLVGELVRRVSGRSIGALLREEIAGPLGLSGLYIGAPEDANPRIATLKSRIRMTPEIAAQRQRFMASDSIAAQALGSNLGDLNELLNTPEGRAAEIPAANGVMTARDLARMYACLAQGGALDGVCIISHDTVRRMSERQTFRKDLVIMFEIGWALGYMTGGSAVSSAGPRVTAFGHPGFGGSIGFADPEIEMAFGFVPNALTLDLLGGSRSQALTDAARASIAKLG